MKVNIDKYQYGGLLTFGGIKSTTPPDQTPRQASPSREGASSSGKSSKKSASDGILSKELIKELAKNGLPNETNYIFDQLSLLEDPSLTDNQVKSLTIEIAKKINNTLYNSEKLEDATKKAVETGSINDFAYNGSSVYARSAKNGEVKLIDIDKVAKSKGKYVPLTIGQLTELRAYDNSTLFNSGTIETIETALSTSGVVGEVWDMVKQLGSDTTDIEQYVKATGIQPPTKKEKEGLEAIKLLQEQYGEDYLFKLKEHSKTPKIKDALEFIHSALGYKKVQLLENNAKLTGQEHNSFINIISNAINSGTSTEYSRDIEAPKIPSSSSSEAKKSAAKEYSMTPMETLFDGNINQTKVTITNPKYKNQYAMQLQGNLLAALPKDNGKSVGFSPLNIALDAGGIGVGKYLNYHNMYYGNKKISQAQLQTMMYNGSQVAQVFAPINSSGEIDFQLLDLYSDVQMSLEKEGILKMEDVEQRTKLINEAYANAGLQIAVDENGKFISGSKVAPFLMLNAYSNNGDIQENNSYIRELKGDESKQMEDYMDQVYEVNKLDGVGMFDDISIAPVFIKVSPNAANDAKIYADHGQTVAKQDLQETMMRQQIQQGEQNPQIVANSSILYDK